MKSFFTTLKRTNLRYSTIILPYLIVAAIAAAGRIAMNLLSGQMSEAAVQHDTDAIIYFIILITGVLILRAGASAISTLITARFSAKAGFRLRDLFVNHFLRVPFSKLEKFPSGEQLSIYSNDIPRAESLISSGFLGLIADFLTFISAFAFLIYISPSLTGVLILASIGMVIVQALLSMPLNKLSQKMSKEQAKCTAVVNDSLQNLSVVAAYSLDEVLEERYMTAYNKFFAAIKRAVLALAVTLGMMISLMFSPLIVIVVVLGLATIDGSMTLAEFIAFATTITMVAGGLTMVGQNIASFAQSAAGARRLLDATSDPLEELENGEKSDTTTATISFKNVSFTYHNPSDESEAKPKAKPKKKKGIQISFGSSPPMPEPEEEPVKEITPTLALDDASFDIIPGSKVAIVGGSGSGKSTILKLLLGLYEPTSGEVTIGERSTTEFAKGNLRNVFAYVPQDSFLFPESISKNITLEDGVSDMPRLEKACADAGILDFINSLPNRFGGVLTEAADNISGGQRQRIAMARAFYKDAPVILFDEATSSLDPVTEAAVVESLNCAASNKTVIIVAHRASAIAACDTIIVMDGGKVSGIGSHKEMLATNDVYRGLYEKKGA